jgi:hypothetical protein
MSNLMVLPSSDPSGIRVIRVPDDFESQEAYRHVTGLIAAVESRDPEYRWDDIAEALETRGYEVVEFLLGPSLD